MRFGASLSSICITKKNLIYRQDYFITDPNTEVFGYLMNHFSRVYITVHLKRILISIESQVESFRNFTLN